MKEAAHSDRNLTMTRLQGDHHEGKVWKLVIPSFVGNQQAPFSSLLITLMMLSVLLYMLIEPLFRVLQGASKGGAGWFKGWCRDLQKVVHEIAQATTGCCNQRFLTL